MSKYVLGIDISTSTGYCIINQNNELIIFGCLKLKKKELRDRISELVKEIKKLIKQFKPSIIILEEVFQGPNRKTTAFLNKLQGSIISIIPDNVDLIIVQVSKARKQILGKGQRYSKEDVYYWAINKFDLKNFDFKKHNDITDAILLAEYGFLVNKVQ